MTKTIIEVKNLSKEYTIGEMAPYGSLREEIVQTLSAPFKRLRSRSQLSINKTIWALRNVSFEVREGEVMGIIGRNGAGKSTLLKILSRITEPTEGEIRMQGRVASLLEVGTGFHSELTGRENIFLNGAILGMTRQEIKKKFDEIVDFAEIEKFLDTPVKRYSSGMYVRLAFAVAAHLEPEILLVDEVLSVGDAAFQKKCLGKMGDVAKTGRTVFFVSHNMSAIRRLCGSAIWLDNGQIVNRGLADEIVRDYEQSQIIHLSDSSCVVERNPEDVKYKSFYISRIEMMNVKGENTNIFSYNDSLVLIIDVAGEPLESNYGVEFRIYKDSGEFVSVGASASYHGIYFNKKTKNIRIEIGPLILTNGKYTTSLSLVTGVVRDESLSRVDSWDSACSFNVIECHPFTTAHDIDKRSICILQQSFHSIE